MGKSKLTEPVTVIFFSCRRLNLLERTIGHFLQLNTYPIQELIIVNDSGDKNTHDYLKRAYGHHTLVLNEGNVGLMKSIDLGYAHIKTNYFFHSEDDWMVTRGGFIEKSLEIMLDEPDIEEVWLADYNNHPIAPEIYNIHGVKYGLVSENVNRYIDGYDEGWHGFTTACGLKRLSDYHKVAPYSEINYKGSWKKKPTIWHKEYAIGLAYHNLGYRTAVLIDTVYAENIGIGQSEYKTGDEK